MTDLSYVIFVRLYVEVADLASAQLHAEELMRLLRPLGDFELKEVRQYWKIPEYYEIYAVLDSREPVQLFKPVTDALGQGWEITLSEFDNEAIWIPEDGEFSIPQCRWAHINEFQQLRVAQ